MPRPVAVTLGLLTLSAIGTTLISISQATAFQLVGVHPQAFSQPEDSSGRELKSLAAWNGKIYAGYGDWNRNTGPVYFTAFDPVASTFSATAEHIADTESVEIWKVVGGKLYAIHVDPKSHNGATYSVGTPSTSTATPLWSNVSKVTMTHAFGLTTGSTESEIFLAGQLDEGSSTNEVAKVHRSTDGGTTWTESLSVPSTGGYNRMMFISKLGNQIYAQGMSSSDFNGTNQVARAWVFNGSGWAKATPIAGTTQPYNGSEFAGKILALTSPRGGNLVAYDGRTTTTVRPSTRDYKVHSDGYVYALTSYNSKQSIMRTKDLTSWELLTAAPRNSRSIAILGNTIFIGTSESELYKAEINPSITDSTPPTASIIAPAAGYTATTANEFAINAADPASIDRVEFYVGEYRIGSVSSKASDVSGCFGGSCFNETATYPGSYSIRWNGSGVTPGTYSFKAIAYDLYGNSTETASIPMTVPAGLYPPDVLQPVVTVGSPAPDQRVRKNVWISAAASDNDQLATFEVQLDGVVVAANSANSISKSFPVGRGSHSVVVTATDRAGNVTTVERSFTSR